MIGSKSAKKDSLQVAGWQAALFRVPNLKALTRWQLPGCFLKWDKLKSEVLSWGPIFFSKLQREESWGGAGRWLLVC